MTDEKELLFGNGDLPDPNKDYFSELVGEGKKFRDEKELARGKAESDAFIALLQAENKRLREETERSIKLEALLDKIEKKTVTNTDEVNRGTPPGNEPPAVIPPTNTNALTEEKLNQILQQKEQEATQKANLAFVAQKLKDTYGDKFQEVVNKRAKDLDLPEEELLRIAKTRPNAFLNMIGNNSQVQKEEPRKTQPSLASVFSQSVNPSALKSNSSGPPKKFSDFEKIRKEQGWAGYFKPEVQQEMLRLTKEYGDDFLRS